MTLLERFDSGDFDQWTEDAVATVRRALAIAQAVDEMAAQEPFWTVRQALRRADELLRGDAALNKDVK